MYLGRRSAEILYISCDLGREVGRIQQVGTQVFMAGLTIKKGCPVSCSGSLCLKIRERHEDVPYALPDSYIYRFKLRAAEKMEQSGGLYPGL